jgi:hypothetical protein
MQAKAHAISAPSTGGADSSASVARPVSRAKTSRARVKVGPSLTTELSKTEKVLSTTLVPNTHRAAVEGADPQLPEGTLTVPQSPKKQQQEQQQRAANSSGSPLKPKGSPIKMKAIPLKPKSSPVKPNGSALHLLPGSQRNAQRELWGHARKATSRVPAH